ncbi:MAG: sigma-70 family RNA polymerase sigma factor [Myxococcales bacterium]|nr:sigma-70 family RNA polymerase sigma factor [Myxococcales bacterium]
MIEPVSERTAPPLSTILEDVTNGRADATRDLLPAMYQELRVLAEARLRKLPPGQTLQPTALVHEAYLALSDKSDVRWSGRAHFFGAAARAMNEILIDQARRKSASKRNNGQRAVGLDHAELVRALAPSTDDVLAVSAAIKKLDSEHPRQAEVVLLRTLAGLTDSEIAELLSVTTRTVERDFRFARAFLARELSR